MRPTLRLYLCLVSLHDDAPVVRVSSRLPRPLGRQQSPARSATHPTRHPNISAWRVGSTPSFLGSLRRQRMRRADILVIPTSCITTTLYANETKHACYKHSKTRNCRSTSRDTSETRKSNNQNKKSLTLQEQEKMHPLPADT